MRKTVIRPQAEVDLLEIWHHIAASGGVDAANRAIEKLDTTILGLAPMPGMGHERSDVDDRRSRFWGERPYVIAYRFDDEPLIVERVVHGHRDFRSLFPPKP